MGYSRKINFPWSEAARAALTARFSLAWRAQREFDFIVAF